jgi:hypothetical protein
VDGDLGTHWRASVTDTDRVRLDLDAVVRPIRLVLRLGPHFGEYPTALRVETSVDGAQWRTVRETGLVPAPLAQLRAHADDLSVSLALAPGPARIVRLVVPAPHEAPRLPIPRRGEWGAHEIELHVE